ncbi:MAG TPA: neprosin family prolyl endopeptidase, partial [Steroidobacteraceae bacterium]|nr:neprosin family prolyl endopeptidase [Steroidobacteraceae bacterium]
LEGGLRPLTGWAFKYAATITQTLTAGRYARGVKATLLVEHPPIPAGATLDHSLAEIAAFDPSIPGTLIEAGWMSEAASQGPTPRLFVAYWVRGQQVACFVPLCVVGGGWVQTASPAIQPGGRVAALRTGSRVRLEWRQSNRRWWLLVNGKRVGYYPDSLWQGQFTHIYTAEVFGEVLYRSGECIQMGNGKWPWRRGAASISDVAFIGGPSVSLRRRFVSPGYGLRLTGANSFRYGGPGC